MWLEHTGDYTEDAHVSGLGVSLREITKREVMAVRRLMGTMICVVICIAAQMGKSADAVPFDYLPLAQSARIETGFSTLVTYIFADIEPRQDVATGGALRSKALIRPSIGWQGMGIGLEAGAKVAASLFYSRVDWNPYIKLGVGQQLPFAFAVLSDLEVKGDSDVVPRITTVASYTAGKNTTYAAGDLTIRDGERNWGAELGMDRDVNQHLSLVLEIRAVFSEYWKAYVVGVGWLVHF